MSNYNSELTKKETEILENHNGTDPK